MNLLLRRSIRLSFCCSTLLLVFVNLCQKANALDDKIITVNVNGSGIIYVGRDTISSDELAMYIRQRLFKSYTGTGKMYDAVKLAVTGDPQSIVIEIVKKEIANGLSRTLDELCLEKHKKLYDDLSSRQKSKLKRNFKVLFQDSYE